MKEVHIVAKGVGWDEAPQEGAVHIATCESEMFQANAVHTSEAFCNAWLIYIFVEAMNNHCRNPVCSVQF